MNPDITRMIEAVIKICQAEGCIGFVGAFRTQEGFHCFYIEHPYYRDGTVRDLQNILQSAVDVMGMVRTVSFEGLIRVTETPSNTNP